MHNDDHNDDDDDYVAAEVDTAIELLMMRTMMIVEREFHKMKIFCCTSVAMELI